MSGQKHISGAQKRQKRKREILEDSIQKDVMKRFLQSSDKGDISDLGDEPYNQGIAENHYALTSRVK